jgi:hypothetical protein
VHRQHPFRQFPGSVLHGERWTLRQPHLARGNGHWPLGRGQPANQFGDGTICDCQAVGPIAAGQATNIAYLTPSTGQPLTQTGYLAVNQQACYSGASTPTNPPKCGKVNRYPGDVRYTNYGNVLVKNLVEVESNKLQPGDSGSPGVFRLHCRRDRRRQHNYNFWYYHRSNERCSPSAAPS